MKPRDEPGDVSSEVLGRRAAERPKELRKALANIFEGIFPLSKGQRGISLARCIHARQGTAGKVERRVMVLAGNGRLSCSPVGPAGLATSKWPPMLDPLRGIQLASCHEIDKHAVGSDRRALAALGHRQLEWEICGWLPNRSTFTKARNWYAARGSGRLNSRRSTSIHLGRSGAANRAGSRPCRTHSLDPLRNSRIGRCEISNPNAAAHLPLGEQSLRDFLSPLPDRRFVDPELGRELAARTRHVAQHIRENTPESAGCSKSSEHSAGRSAEGSRAAATAPPWVTSTITAPST